MPELQIERKLRLVYRRQASLVARGAGVSEGGGGLCGGAWRSVLLSAGARGVDFAKFFAALQNILRWNRVCTEQT